MTPAVRVQKVSKTFGGRTAVDQVSFDLPEGAFLSIFGPNGAGKTTLLRMIATLVKPTSGTISLFGTDVRERSDEARSRVGLVSHASMLYPDLTALENLEFYARLYGVADPHARAMELLEAVGLKHRRLDVVKGFSRGMTQRLAIARALVHDPRIVLLDEPYSGLDPHAADVFDGIIAQLREGRTFLMVSHDVTKGLALASHVLVMARGRIVAFDRRDAVDDDAFAAVYRQAVGSGVA